MEAQERKPEINQSFKLNWNLGALTMSESLSNEQVRKLVLNLLIKKEEEDEYNPEVTREEMIQKAQELQIPEKTMHNTMYRLKKEGIIDFPITSVEGWQQARLTEGTKKQVMTNFSIVNNNTIVQGQNNAIIQTGSNSIVNFSQQVSNAFNHAYQMIEARSDISTEQKEEIKNKTKQLEGELKEAEPDVGKIQQFWKWIKQNANWLTPSLTQAVLDGIKIACGNP